MDSQKALTEMGSYARESNFLLQQLSVALQRGGMQSHFKTRSLLASSLQSVV